MVYLSRRWTPLCWNIQISNLPAHRTQKSPAAASRILQKRGWPRSRYGPATRHGRWKIGLGFTRGGGTWCVPEVASVWELPANLHIICHKLHFTVSVWTLEVAASGGGTSSGPRTLDTLRPERQGRCSNLEVTPRMPDKPGNVSAHYVMVAMIP